MGVIWSIPQDLVTSVGNWMYPVELDKEETYYWNRNTQIKWDKEGADELLREIKERLSPFKEKKQTLNILVIGPTSCGKSSLCNGFKTTLNQKKEVVQFFRVGRREDESYTKNFQFTTLGDCVTLYDMAGVFESRHIKTEDILSIIQGRVKFTGKIDDFMNPTPPATSEAQNNVSCLVLVLKPGMELPVHLKRIIEQIHKTAGEGELGYHVILTHLDEVDHCFKDTQNLNKLFSSPVVQKKVEYISKQVGTPPNTISFVRNYCYETQSDINSDVLFLHAFKQIINAACEQEEKRAEFAAAAAAQD
ncbi:uncharacterized protein LOC124119557 [Haliotis rufescens]|uniref:uncharacterized protein LOC124119557 n=1 Tax=Haliotis rufescens TaxID=6454 RepID=UPI001EB0A54A|nr:uncharacterized protein LOC124119557 [Haliotis rufescens]